jgi:hypothetical protein
MLIREVRADHYVIPLPTALSDRTHGTMEGFELITARVRASAPRRPGPSSARPLVV